MCCNFRLLSIFFLCRLSVEDPATGRWLRERSYTLNPSNYPGKTIKFLIGDHRIMKTDHRKVIELSILKQ